MPPTGDAYNVDWIFSKESNVHIANHRDWFTTFTAFPTWVTIKDYVEVTMTVVGIGEVELPVRTHQRSASLNRKLILHDVLYAPTCICNIVGDPILRQHTISPNFPAIPAVLRARAGHQAALFDFGVFVKLWLVGIEKGATSLDRDIGFTISVTWPHEESVRWAPRRRLLGPKPGVASQSVDVAVQTEDVANQPGHLPLVADAAAVRSLAAGQPPMALAPFLPYTSAEKTWLKRAHGGEQKFMNAYGLDSSKQQHLNEAHVIARGLIDLEAAVIDNAGEGGTDEDVEDGDKEGRRDSVQTLDAYDFWAELDEEARSEVIGQEVSVEEVQYIQRHHENPGNFFVDLSIPLMLKSTTTAVRGSDEVQEQTQSAEIGDIPVALDV